MYLVLTYYNPFHGEIPEMCRHSRAGEAKNHLERERFDHRSVEILILISQEKLLEQIALKLREKIF